MNKSFTGDLTFLDFLVAFSRVLNEFILKNPNLESKKDQRELQVITAATLSAIHLSIVSIKVFHFLLKNIL